MPDTEARTQARRHLLAALRADLIGPFRPDTEETPSAEDLHLPPSRWYLTGFLAPPAGREIGEPTDDEMAAGPDVDEEETQGHEPEVKRRSVFPASMGLSVLLLPGTGGTVRATLRWADYRRVEADGTDQRARKVWRRHPREPITVDLPLDAALLQRGIEVPDSGGVRLKGQLRTTSAPGLAQDTRALAVFVVNERDVPGKPPLDESFLFQIELELESGEGFVPRPNRAGENSSEPDDRIADLQFRGRFEYAVGHGVSVEIPDSERVNAARGAPVHRVRTTWLPVSEVHRVVTRDEPGVVVSMDELAALADGAAARAALLPLMDAYTAWVDVQSKREVGSVRRTETRDEVIRQARRAAGRIRVGINLLAQDAEVLDAFRLANRAMAQAAQQRNPERYADGSPPSWRLFQLAFLLLSLPSATDPRHADRECVELIFFPTGGGKTEAYLGVIAFTLLLRRLRGQSRADRGLGVAVILRYTLRLLTLDQLGRAATLICALEQLRLAAPDRLGDVRFSVGLWVGKSATANTMAEVKRRIDEYKSSSSKSAPSPCPLTHCPWCGEELDKKSLTYGPDVTRPVEVTIGCNNFRACAFAGSKNREGLPVVFVDEQVYRELPCFLVATVDKFAMLPWRGETGMLFGRASAREARAFFGPLDGAPPKGATALPEGLLPPELVVQDELHLISGPLGTMVGLYETAIEALCCRRIGDSVLRPKILAATATVRRARDQVRALFARRDMALFPPPGIDDSETWFATVDREGPGRAYVGVAAPGRSVKAICLRVYVALLGASQKLYRLDGPRDQVADAYMTLAGYFNSLRELGGMRRLVEDDVRTRCAKIEERVPEDAVNIPNPWFRNRKLQAEPVELTSREPTARIARAKARLAQPHAETDHVDVVLASNMISVGVDIDRLGLMVVCGQPKTTSEYIQASSRVGRQHPGLVVTCLNVHKPRDRSHYERFCAYHESFYRNVEAQSLTPFSGPALERGLAGTLVAMVRLLSPAMTPASGAMELAEHRELAERVVRAIAERAGGQRDGSEGDETVQAMVARGQDLLDAWDRVVTTAIQGAGKRSYSPFDRAREAGKPLLWTLLDDERPSDGTPEAKFAAPTSMRDVEATTHLWIERRAALGGKH